MAISTVETPTPTAVTKNASAVPITASSTPAAAGPTIRIDDQIMEVSATALGMTRISMSLGMSDCCAGLPMAARMPVTMLQAMTTQMFARPAKMRMGSAIAEAAYAAFE